MSIEPVSLDLFLPLFSSPEGCNFCSPDEVIEKIVTGYPSIIHLLHRWQEIIPHHSAIQWFEKGKKKKDITYGDLWEVIEQYAMAIASLVKPMELVVLLFEPGIDFYVHFYACLRANVIPLPCYPPVPANPQKGIDIVTKIISSAGCTNIIMSENIDRLRFWRGKWPKSLSNGSVVRYSTIKRSMLAKNTICSLPFPKKEDLAFIQYTSGSTGDPKGVMVGHDNLMRNLSLVIRLLTSGERPVHVTWLPQYHDMGLALAVSGTLFVGGTVVAMSPLDFLADPLLWFELISLTKGTHSVAPNFAFGLVTRKWNSVRARKWDLSSLLTLGNSAEPVLLHTINKFKEKMMTDVPSFQADHAILPGYGMAECVAAIGSASFGTPIIVKNHPENGRPIIASIPFAQRFGGVAIVLHSSDGHDENSVRSIAPEGVEGEIWLSNPMVARGYWNNPELTKKTFQNVLPDFDSSDSTLSVLNTDSRLRWLATGDLGFLEGGHLFVSGRMKDLIIINGKNLYPQDIEFHLQLLADTIIRNGCVAAFNVSNVVHDSEGYVAVCEIRDTAVKELQRTNTSLERIGEELFQKLSSEFSGLIQIVFIKERSIPKTTSGKLKRSYTKELWMQQKLSVVLQVPESVGIFHPKNMDSLLVWIEPVVIDSLPSMDEEMATDHRQIIIAIKEISTNVLADYSILDQQKNLSHQGLDSLRVGELHHRLLAVQEKLLVYLPLVQYDPITNLNSLFEWTGEDIVRYLCTGRSPIQKDDALQAVYSMPRSESSAKHTADDTSPMKKTRATEEVSRLEEEIKTSYSLGLRVCFECMGILGIVLSLVASLIPSLFFYDRLKDLGGEGSVLGLWRIDSNSDEIIWISYGVVLILATPLFALSLTAVVIVQKQLIWRLVLSNRDFIPIHSWIYYLWWYLDRLVYCWEAIVFTFISGTHLVNLAYFLMGGIHVSPYATITCPVRYPDLLTVGKYSSIDGLVYCHSFSPLGVHFAPITIGTGCTIATWAVVQEGTIIEDNVTIRPLSTVPKFTVCTGNYVWEGTPCQRGATKSPLSLPTDATWSNISWYLERLARLLTAFSLPWGSMIALACAVRLWFVFFPTQPPTVRVGNFWYSIFLYYGTGCGWIVFILLFKWIVFGKAQEGPYHPNLVTRILRWSLKYYTTVAEGLVITHFFFPLVHLWCRLFGQQIHPTATLVRLRLAHPADADLIEIQESASVSWIDADCYDTETNVRSKIVVGKNSEVWLGAYLDAGCVIQEDSVVSAGVYIPKHSKVEARTSVLDSTFVSTPKRLASTRSLFSSEWNLATTETVNLPEDMKTKVNISTVNTGKNPFLAIGAIIMDFIVIFGAILPLWFCYYIYRECISQGGFPQWCTLAMVLLFGLVLLMVCYAAMNRIFAMIHYFVSSSTNTNATSIHLIRLMMWKMMHQYRHIFQHALALWSGSLFFNLMVNISGGNVAMTAKIFNIGTFPDWTLTHVGDFAVMCEKAYLEGHHLKDQVLLLDRVICGAYSCLEPLSLLFAEQTVKRWGRLGSSTTVSGKDLPSGYYKLGGRMMQNPLFSSGNFLLRDESTKGSPIPSLRRSNFSYDQLEGNDIIRDVNDGEIEFILP